MSQPLFENPAIYVDADACPVKDEVLKVAERHGLIVTFVSNGGLRPSRDPMVRHVVVSKGADAADDWIVEHVTAGDIVVTADIALASRCLAKGAAALGNTGAPFTEDNIGDAMATRTLLAELRGAGEITKGPRAFTARDRSRFLQSLEDAVQRSLREQRRDARS